MKGNETMQTIVNITYPAFALFAFACFALAPQARATCQEGCLTNGNTVLGDQALLNNTTGIDNTAAGYYALFSNTTGSFNTATGTYALDVNTTGYSNTATGYYALFSNTTGSDNTATGFAALSYNTTGNNNTANGELALYGNTTGDNNTANGYYALFSNTTGSNNTANGWEALGANQNGGKNTAIGQGALSNNTTGSKNTAVGQSALNRNTTGSSNIAIGLSAGVNLTTGNNNIDIFDRGVAGEANTIRIGNAGTQTATFIAGISGATVPTGVPVVVDSGGHLGTTTSSERFKDAIKPMDKASEAILALKPVTFRYKHDLDPEGVPQFGLVAEQVEKVNPDLVARDEQGKPYTVRYEAVNAMLLNEFLKEHRKVQTLEASLAQVEKDSRARAAKQQCEIDSLTATLKAQAAQIQQVSDQLRAQAQAPRVVANN
jgi:hypothetical protein